jgi:hypothetical protein
MGANETRNHIRVAGISARSIGKNSGSKALGFRCHLEHSEKWKNYILDSEFWSCGKLEKGFR